ncbi:Conserved_hypothetical protein [Hexamita inflata]|uniref:Uncharacterized protein n=1 Tax=Hexamita inflata TaxID=28002 RepID=A0AA86QBZ1_9EUKA|nr:Conserved hypothetical protein [Hexamita inflata]
MHQNRALMVSIHPNTIAYLGYHSTELSIQGTLIEEWINSYLYKVCIIQYQCVKNDNYHTLEKYLILFRGSLIKSRILITSVFQIYNQKLSRRSTTFKSTYKRDDLYIHAEKHKSEQEAAIEQEKLVQEDRQEKRQVGGLETAVNFTLAKVQDNRNITFGTTMDRRTGLPIDPDMPSPGSYEIHQQKPRQTTLYKSERVNSYIPDLQRLPAVLQEGVGPSAERALNILAERKLEQCALGPGSYAGEVGYKIKKSFNAAAGK